MGSALGGGAADQVFGGGSAAVLTKWTVWGVLGFFIISFGLYLIAQSNRPVDAVDSQGGGSPSTEQSPKEDGNTTTAGDGSETEPKENAGDPQTSNPKQDVKDPLNQNSQEETKVPEGLPPLVPPDGKVKAEENATKPPVAPESPEPKGGE